MDPATIGVFSGFVAVLMSALTAIMLHLDKKVDKRLERVENRLDRVENRLDGLDNRLERIEEHLGKLALAVAGVVGGSKESTADPVAAAGAGATTG